MARSSTVRTALFATLLGLVAVPSLPSTAAWARDDLADARASLAKGDLKTAQIQLRNAVRDDPQNAEAHYQLGALSLQLGDGAAAQREAQSALERGFDAAKATELLAQSYLGQNKARELLRDLTPEGKPPDVAAKILVSRGYAMLATGDAKSAQGSFEQAEALAPTSIEPLLADSRLALGMRDAPRAHAKLDAALALEPRAPDALMRKFELQRAEGDVPGAAATLEDIIKNNPNLLPPRVERAAFLIASDKDDAAKPDVDFVLQALPNNVPANYLRAVLLYHAKDLAGADALLAKLAPAMNSIPRAFFLQAVIKTQLGQMAQAEEAADRFLARMPNDGTAQKLVAEIALRRGKPDRAIAVLQPLADSPKADIGLYDLIARAYAGTGQQARAVEYFEKEAALAPGDAALRQRLATSRMGMGDLEHAMSDLEKSFDLAPKEVAPAAQLFFADLATGDLDRTAASLAKIRAAQGDTPLVQSLDGQLKLARLDTAAARAAFERLVADHPEFIQGKVSLARMDLSEGRIAEADVLLGSILKDQPATEPALTMLVASQFAQNKPELAIQTLQRAHDASLQDARLTATLADAHTRSNDPAAAMKLLADPAVGADGSVTLLAARSRAQAALKDQAGLQASYRAMLALDPHAVDARRLLATLFVTSNNGESARILLEEGMRADPKDMRIVTDYVGLDLREHGLSAALATADRLRRNAPDVDGMRSLRGDLYMADKKPDQAIGEYAKEFKAAPDQSLLLRLVNAHIQSGKRDDAKGLLAQWSKAHPDDILVAEGLSGMLISEGDFAKAEPILAAIVDRAPRNAAALNNLAWVLSLRKDPRALGLAQKAYLLGPSPATADTLGWILTSQGENEKALVLLREANTGGRNPQIAYHFAVALKNSGHPDEAVRVLTALTQSDAKFNEKPEAEKLLSDLRKG